MPRSHIDYNASVSTTSPTNCTRYEIDFLFAIRRRQKQTICPGPLRATAGPGKHYRGIRGALSPTGPHSVRHHFLFYPLFFVACILADGTRYIGIMSI